MEATATITHLSPIEAEIGRLRNLQKQGRHFTVLQDVQRLLRKVPENRDALLILAASQRHTMHSAEALATLDRLEGLQPRFSLLHQERGLVYVAMKDAPKAIDAFLRAVNINPSLPTAWKMLEGVYRIAGDMQNATTAAAHVATLRNLPPEIVSATSMFFDGDLSSAEEVIRAFLLRHGNHPEGMRLLAKIAVAHDVLDDAELLLEGVLVLTPDHRAARFDYADTLLKRNKYPQAREQVRRLLEIEPDNPDYRALAATTAVGLGEQEHAIAIYRQLLAERPESPDMHLWLAHALKTVGRVSEAIESYRAAAAARPSFGDAYWSLANLKLYAFSDDEIAR